MALPTKFLIAALLAASPAAAADLALPEVDAPAPALVAPPLWTGFYLGGFVGGATTDGEARRGAYGGALIDLDVRNGLFPGSIDDRDDSLLGGVNVGYNRQFGAFVGGVEADVSFLDLDAVAGFNRRDPNPDPRFFNVQTITGYGTSVDTLGTLRARLGVAFDRTLVYATGGLAVGDVENRFTLRLPELGYSSPGWSRSGTQVGYAVGGGVEHKLTRSVSLKAEALYYDLEDVTVLGTDPVAFPGQSLSYEFRNDGVVGRVGLNFAF